MDIIIETPAGNTRLNNLNLTDTIKTLKRTIEILAKISPVNQTLVFENKALDNDSYTLAEYKIKDKSIVRLLLNLKIRNFTEHYVIVGETTYPRDDSKYVARAKTAPQKQVAELTDSTPIFEAPRFEGLEKPLPDNVDPTNQTLLMSKIGAEAARASGYKGRIFVPDTGPDSVIRDDKGAIKSVKRFHQA